MTNVEIQTLENGTTHRLLVDGVDLSRAVKRVEIVVDADHDRPSVKLTLTDARVLARVISDEELGAEGKAEILAMLARHGQVA